MALCPHCQTSIDEDFGMVTCPGCDVVLSLDFDGNIQEASEGQAGNLEENVAEYGSEVASSSAEAMSSDVVPFEPEAYVDPSTDVVGVEQNGESPPVETNENQFSIDSELDLPEEITSSNSIEFEAPQSEAGIFQATEDFEQKSEVTGMEGETQKISQKSNEKVNALSFSDPRIQAFFEETSEEEVDVPLDVSEFGNPDEPDSSISQLQYDLLITGIDSKEIRISIKDALTDRRFLWDTGDIIDTIAEGLLRINGLNALKCMIIINRIKSLPIEIHWKQL